MFNKLLATEYSSLEEVAKGIEGMIQKVLGPVLIVIGVMAVVFAIYLGVLYAKAEDSSKRKEVQGRLIGAIIGAVIIIVGVTLCYAIDWVGVFENFSNINLDDGGAKKPAAGEGEAANIASLIRLMVR